jgi:large subunit ribosomal protein L17
MQDVQDRDVVAKLFDSLAPRFADRPGGYTRLLRIGYRKGDSAEVAQVELVGSEFDPRAKAETEATTDAEKPKTKGVGGRLRAAAERLRGGKKAESAASESAAATEAKAAKRAAKKGTAGRKMGGSSKGK